MHLPTLTRMVAKSIRYPDRAIKGALEMIKLGRMDPSDERQKLFTFLRDAFDVDPAQIQDEFDSSRFCGLELCPAGGVGPLLGAISFRFHACI